VRVSARRLRGPRGRLESDSTDTVAPQLSKLASAASAAGGAGAPAPLFYKARAVPESVAAVVAACVEGDLARLREAWRPAHRAAALGFTREDTCHPLLHAA